MTIGQEPPTLEAVCVYGGYRLAWAWWTRTENGWEWDRDWISETVYETKEACQRAIVEMANA